MVTEMTNVRWVNVAGDTAVSALLLLIVSMTTSEFNQTFHTTTVYILYNIDRLLYINPPLF